jgi:diguanylate cyclase (GGDEF)-like protein/PAS domain S-box-containing protein
MNFFGALFPSDIHELFMRLLIILILLASSIYIQFIMNKLNETETEYKRTQEKLELMLMGQTVDPEAGNGILKEATAELVGTKTHLEHLLTSTSAVLYSARASGDYGATFISRNIMNQLGWKAEDFIEDSSFWSNHIHPDDSPRIFAELPKLFEYGKHIQEYRFLHKDGEYRWVHDELVLIKDKDGNPKEIVGYWSDITDHKRIEEELILKKSNLEEVVAERNGQLKNVNENLVITKNELELINRENNLLSELVDMLQVVASHKEAYDIIYQYLQKIFPRISECGGAMYIFKSSRKLLETVNVWGNPLSSEIFTPNECWAIRRGQVYNANDPDTIIPCHHILKTHEGRFLPYICVPIMSQGEVLGVISIQYSTHILNEKITRLVKTIAKDIGLSLTNIILRETLLKQSIRDSLTGLYNRRYLDEVLEREVQRAIRKRTSLGIIMIDIDYFEKFNDNFGHGAGDFVLHAVGDFLKDNTRMSDIVCRYGGEEFVVTLVESSLEETKRRAEELRAGIKKLHLRYNNQLLKIITLSLGVAILPMHSKTPDGILKAADSALYRAKEGGRDRVAIAEN